MMVHAAINKHGDMRQLEKNMKSRFRRAKSVFLLIREEIGKVFVRCSDRINFDKVRIALASCSAVLADSIAQGHAF